MTSGFRVYWKRLKARQYFNFINAQNDIKNGIFRNREKEDIEKAYRKRLISKSQKLALIKLLEIEKQKRRLENE